MKFLIFSDIHGAEPVAERIQELAARHAPDAIVILGDVLYHGPRNPLPKGYNPKATAELLRPLAPSVIAVQGNCDSEVDAMVLPFPLASGFSWIFDGAPQGKASRIFATHGHQYGPQLVPPLLQGDVLLFGHTHVPQAETRADGIRLCNPGSLALPKEGSPPCFGIFENGEFSVYTENERLHMRSGKQ